MQSVWVLAPAGPQPLRYGINGTGLVFAAGDVIQPTPLLLGTYFRNNTAALEQHGGSRGVTVCHACQPQSRLAPGNELQASCGYTAADACVGPPRVLPLWLGVACECTACLRRVLAWDVWDAWDTWDPHAVRACEGVGHGSPVQRTRVLGLGCVCRCGGRCRVRRSSRREVVPVEEHQV